MSTATVPVPAARVRVAFAQDAIALSGIAVLVGGLLAATWGAWGDLDSDTGYDAAAGARVADGELPYRDFTYYYGPLAPLASGAAAWLGGSGLAPAIAFGMVVAVAIVAATYGLARIVVDPLGAFLAAGLTAAVAFIPNNYSFVLPHTHAATLGTLLVLLMLLAIWRYAALERPAWLLAAGACAGLATLTKPEPALAAIFAGLVWLALRGRSGARFGRELARFAAPALLIPAAVYGAFLTAVSPRVLALDNLYPLDELRAGGDALVKVRIPMTLESFAIVGGKLALYAAGAAGLVLLARLIDRAAGARRRLLVGATVAAGALVVAVALVKPDGIRDGLPYVLGWIPAGAVLALAIASWRFHRREGAWTAKAQVELAAAGALAVLALMAYGSFVFHGWRPQMAVYAAPLAGLLLARLHLVELVRGRMGYLLGAAWLTFLVAVMAGFTVKDSRAESASVHGPGGSLSESPAEAAMYQRALDIVAERTRPGDPILVAPLMTGLYVLSGHESPLRELSMLPSALPTAADEDAAIARLERSGAPIVITDDRTMPAYGQAGFGDSFHKRLAFWVRRNYVHTQTLEAGSDSSRSLDIWERRAR